MLDICTGLGHFFEKVYLLSHVLFTLALPLNQNTSIKFYCFLRLDLKKKLRLSNYVGTFFISAVKNL
jgi:hypothetical protein